MELQKDSKGRIFEWVYQHRTVEVGASRKRAVGGGAKLMLLEVTGFLMDASEDDSLKFALDVNPEFEQGVMKVLGWETLEAESDGELPLTATQVEAIAAVIKKPLPVDLDLFIGVRP
ncbi:pyocin S6 family toxin immunity protein [Pseudomonas quasicaspiana]|uniref:pyocin S6 family toxin immunity protein n=1 Tax=Pseudomonas quasicaspiana TaxID=2829821 RepID=UPI0029E827F6|nr:pyocin S6 family toxin immunity protein [Pseudomonas quasicaspiana]